MVATWGRLIQVSVGVSVGFSWDKRELLFRVGRFTEGFFGWDLLVLDEFSL